MSRVLEATLEERQRVRVKRLGAALDFELEGSFAHAGAVLRGFSVKLRPEDTLVIFRAVLAGREQVCFVGSDNLGSCLLKAVRLAGRDELKWKSDKYAKG